MPVQAIRSLPDPKTGEIVVHRGQVIEDDHPLARLYPNQVCGTHRPVTKPLQAARRAPQAAPKPQPEPEAIQADERLQECPEEAGEFEGVLFVEDRTVLEEEEQHGGPEGIDLEDGVDI